MFEVYHWQAQSRWEKQAFSDVKGTITEERYYANTFIFRALGSTEGNTVLRTIWNTHPKGSLYFCLNYDDKYQQQEKMHNQLTMPHESSNEGNSVNFLDMYQWLKQIRGQVFFMDILNASALSAWVLSYTVGMLTYSTLVLIPRKNTVMKHCPNAHTAFTELLYKTTHAFRGMEREWSRTDL